MTQFVQVDWTALAEDMDSIRKQMARPDLADPLDTQAAIEQMASVLWTLCTSRRYKQACQWITNTADPCSSGGSSCAPTRDSTRGCARPRWLV